jgi:hypothetical protein
MVGASAYLIANIISAQPITLKGFLMSAFIGGISGFVSFGVGEAVSTISNLTAKISVQALLHGINQGMLSGVQGGGFWSGFASGSMSSIASSFWSGAESIVDNGDYTMSRTYINGIGGKFSQSAIGTIVFGSIMGGAGAAMSKGNFWQGAVTGGIVAGLNHTMHEMSEAIAKRKFDKEIDTAYGSKADKAAPVTDATLVEMKNKLPTLKSIYPKTGNALLEAQPELFTASDGAEAKTFAYDTDNYKKANSVFYRSSFSSYRNLAHNMLHEFGHAVHYFNGDFFKYMSGGRRTATQLQNWKEQYAFKFAYNNGGRPYQNDPWYLIHK